MTQVCYCRCFDFFLVLFILFLFYTVDCENTKLPFRRAQSAVQIVPVEIYICELEQRGALSSEDTTEESLLTYFVIKNGSSSFLCVMSNFAVLCRSLKFFTGRSWILFAQKHTPRTQDT